uniref:Mannose-P-dolichol utilization defect 1 protein homolog n=1 Tax=Tetradesmus obliquus TaxID=3088 RepID=A0A383WNW5_TETOB|eukprot:jgi/Sobl393_1/19846/SZX78859.1
MHLPHQHQQHHLQQPQQQQQQLLAARCRIACQALAAASSSFAQQQQCPQQHAAFTSSSRKGHRSCSSRMPGLAGAGLHSGCHRPVCARAASLALAVEPTAAATAAVASAAAVTATSLSFSKVVAVVLGYAVMAGSLFRSVPQIAKVLQHGSTEGLSLTSYVVELCCYSVTIAYNISQGYGFNTFGEVCACWAQDIILIALIFRFSNTKKWIAAAVGIAVSLGCVWLLSPYCPRHVLCALQASNIVTMALGSRLPQIILNMRRGNAGVLSVTTCLLNVAGNAARIFTTIVLTGDMLMLGGFLSQGTLNSILLSQSLTTAQQRRKAAAAAAGPGGVVEDAAAPAVVPKVPAAAAVAAVGPDSSAGAGGFIMQPAT